MPTDTTEIPKQELLIKLLRLTESDNDAESLSALRKANGLLRSAGWDWERLIHGRITVIADPFTNLATPTASATPRASYAPTPPRQPSAPPPPAQPAPPPHRGTPASPISTRENAFAGHCHCCGIEVVAKAGVIFQSHGSSSWKIACTTCNTSATVNRHPASPVRKKRTKSISDLA